jgi:hypothetical protein
MSVKSFKTSGVGVDLAPQGLVLINTTSFSAVASQSINDVFSATYTNYKIVFDVIGSTSNNNLQMRLRVGGADNTTSNYNRQNFVSSSTSNTGTRVATTNLWGAVGQEVSQFFRTTQIFEVYNPFVSAATSALSISPVNYHDGAGIFLAFNGYGFSAATSFTGFSIFPVSGTMTGSVSTYGFNV